MATELATELSVTVSSPGRKSSRLTPLRQAGSFSCQAERACDLPFCAPSPNPCRAFFFFWTRAVAAFDCSSDDGARADNLEALVLEFPKYDTFTGHLSILLALSRYATFAPLRPKFGCGCRPHFYFGVGSSRKNVRAVATCRCYEYAIPNRWLESL